MITVSLYLNARSKGLTYNNMALVTCLNNGSCYCETCHANRLQRFADMSCRELLESFFRSERVEKREVRKAFAEVLIQTAIAKSYRNLIYERFRYKNTKSYLKNNGYTILGRT